MAFILKDWLSGLAATGGLSVDDVALLEGKLGNPKIVETIQQLHEGGLRQADYDRAMNTGKAQLAAETRRLKDLETGMNAWREEAQRKVDEATTKYSTAITSKAQFEAALRQVAADYGLDVNTLIPASSSTPPPSPTPTTARTEAPNEDALRKFQEEIDKSRRVFPFLSAELYDLGTEHQQLFKAPLGKTTELIQRAIDEGKPIRTVWEETFKVSEKRQQVASEERAAHDSAIRAEERKKVISEMSVPTFQPGNGPRSPVLSAFPAKNMGQAKPGEMTSLDRAVADFETRQADRNNPAA